MFKDYVKDHRVYVPSFFILFSTFLFFSCLFYSMWFWVGVNIFNLVVWFWVLDRNIEEIINPKPDIFSI